jgi:Protein of unknown function (DUF3102)
MTTSITAERTEWAARISAAWQKSVDSIIETGRLLLAAKADPKMQHGEWGTMVESDLPFNRHTAHKLIQIASDKRLTNVSQGKHLPPSWTTLYELTKLDDATFDQKLRDGSINPEMQRKDVARANRILNRERDRQRLENLLPIRDSAKLGKQVSAISALSACDPDQAPALDPQAWSMSTPQIADQIDGPFPNSGPVFRRTRTGKLVPYYDRGEIEDGALTRRPTPGNLLVA